MTDPERMQEFEQEALVHLDALYKSALRLSGSPEEAQDLVQETFLKAFRSFHQFQTGTNCRAWLYKILRNSFINRYGQKKKQPHMIDMDDAEPFIGKADEAIGMTPDTYEELLGRVLEDDVKNALMALPEPYRMAIILADLESMPYREIAEVLEVPIGTVMSRLFRARKALRTRLTEAAGRYGIAQGGG